MIVSTPENSLSEPFYFPFDSKLNEKEGVPKPKLNNVAD